MKRLGIALILAALCAAPSFARHPKRQPKPAAVSPIHAVLQWLGLEKADSVVPPPPPPVRTLDCGASVDPNGGCKPTH